jgi:SprT-like protein
MYRYKLYIAAVEKACIYSNLAMRTDKWRSPAFKGWVQKISNLGGNVNLRSLERATKAVCSWKYVCTGCGKEYLRKRRVRNRGKQYVCGGCRGSLREIKI